MLVARWLRLMGVGWGGERWVACWFVMICSFWVLTASEVIIIYTSYGNRVQFERNRATLAGISLRG